MPTSCMGMAVALRLPCAIHQQGGRSSRQFVGHHGDSLALGIGQVLSDSDGGLARDFPVENDFARMAISDRDFGGNRQGVIAHGDNIAGAGNRCLRARTV